MRTHITAEHYRILDETFARLLKKLPFVSSSDREEVDLFLGGGEWLLALEAVCAIIAEGDRNVDQETFGLVRQLATAMGVHDSVDLSAVQRRVQDRNGNDRVLT